MANVRDINQWLQDELARRGRPEVTPNEAAEWLDKAGLLRAGGTARGLPLRNLLRAGRIEGAEQRGSRWAIKRVLDGTTEEDLCRGWTESALREVVQKAIPLRRTILRAIAELDEPTMADVAAHVGVSDRTIPPNLTWAFKAVEPQVVDESGISWPMRFGRRGGLETYSMPDAVSDVILRELDLVEVSPGTVLVASLEDALRRRGLDDRTIQQDFDLSRASDGTLAAVLLVDGDNPAFAVERVAEHGRPSDSVTFDASTRSIRLERPLPESPERMADLALAMRDEIRRASSNLVKDGEELVEAAIRARRAPTTAAADRKAIEQRAVRLATDHFQHAGWCSTPTAPSSRSSARPTCARP